MPPDSTCLPCLPACPFHPLPGTPLQRSPACPHPLPWRGAPWSAWHASCPGHVTRRDSRVITSTHPACLPLPCLSAWHVLWLATLANPASPSRHVVCACLPSPPALAPPPLHPLACLPCSHPPACLTPSPHLPLTPSPPPHSHCTPLCSMGARSLPLSNPPAWHPPESPVPLQLRQTCPHVLTSGTPVRPATPPPIRQNP